MAIRIKRSSGDTAPALLESGQLAYVEGATNGGTLFYGEIGGTVREIAGKKFVDKLNGIEAGAEVNAVDSVAGKTGAVTLAAADVTDFDTAVQAVSINNLVEDTTPQLGGDLDINGANRYIGNGAAGIGSGIVFDRDSSLGLNLETSSSKNIGISAKAIFIAATGGPTFGTTIGNATNGITVLTGQTSPATGTMVTTSGNTSLSITTNNNTNSGLIRIASGANGNIAITPNGTGKIVLDGQSWPNADGPSGYVLKTNGSGVLAWSNINELTASPSSNDVTGALGFTPEDSANKGQPNGYASLDANGFVPATQLPSFVEDVIEVNSITDLEMQFPIGESGKLYVTTDNSQVYRWSGTVYVEIVASPGSTDAVPEGTSNLYFTELRARELFSADGTVSYDDATGLISGTGLSAVVNDQAPELGGDLDVAGQAIVGNEMFFNGNIRLLPGGADGEVQLGGTIVKVGNTENTGNTSIGTPAGNLRLASQISPTGGSEIVLNGGANGSINLTPKGTGGVTQTAGSFTVSAGAVFGQALVSNRNTHITGSQISMFQSHATADANNFGMFRTRGTNTAQEAVQSGDELMEIVVGGNDGSAATNAGLKFAFGMTTTMTDEPSAGFMPNRTDFFVATAANTVLAAMSMASDRVVRVAELGTVSGVTNLNIGAGTDGNIALAPNGTGRVVLDGLSYPSADGTDGQVIKTDGAGNLSFVTPSAGVTTFAALTDTPADFTGSAGFYVKVNSGATALEFSQDVDDGTF